MPVTGRQQHARSERDAGVDGHGGAQLGAAARHVPEHEGRAGHQAADEAAAGLVVTGEQQVQAEHEHGVEGQPHAGLEDHRAAHRGHLLGALETGRAACVDGLGAHRGSASTSWGAGARPAPGSRCPSPRPPAP
jgi:hypothetical protein